MTNLQRQILIEIEDHWNHQMCYLVDKDRLDDADALYLEFVVDGENSFRTTVPFCFAPR